MHQNGLTQSVNLLSKLACALRAWREGMGGGGSFPLAPVPTEGGMEASVSVWECSIDVTGYTASSSNPAATFATEAEFRYHQEYMRMLAVQAAFSHKKKKRSTCV